MYVSCFYNGCMSPLNSTCVVVCLLPDCYVGHLVVFLKEVEEEVMGSEVTKCNSPVEAAE